MIYILHFEPAFHHARHYLGWTVPHKLDERIAKHKAGDGAKIVARAIENGCAVTLSAILPGDKNRERQLKRMMHTKRYCTICNPKRLA